MDSTITITISGVSGSGKTTLSLLIEKALKEAGLTVGNYDFDVVEGLALVQHQSEKLTAIAEKDHFVVIKTEQIHRPDCHCCC